MESVQGLGSGVTKCQSISNQGLRGLLRRQVVAYCLQFWEDQQSEPSPEIVYTVEMAKSSEYPAEVQEVLAKFSDLFQEPNSLPPVRPFDHAIHLLPGVPPVNIRSYRYSPTQKMRLRNNCEKCCKVGSSRTSPVHMLLLCC